MHFLRFELGRDMKRALERGAALAIGLDHPGYRAALDPVPAEVRTALAGDLA